TDPWRDLALIKCAGIKLPGKLPLGSTKSLDVGSFAIAVGRAPLGRGLSIHAGILSATSRFRRKLLQSDARSHKGVWGGCLVNLDGKILGLITVGSDRPKEGAGVTFAMRSEDFAANIVALKKGQRLKEPKAGFLGVYLDAKKSPLTVTRCVKGSPAEKAGIKAGDQLLDIGGLRVNEPKVLMKVLSRLSEGEKVSVLIVRNEKRLRVKNIVLTAGASR
ncbi:MAG: S1C family serine protease, partial [Planctomycetota bacterium]|nr:S1C family serine protease [Planctomycetota bacterium]